MLGVGLSLTGRLRSSVFSPASLFRASEPGVWYDPSDVANLNWRRNLLTWTEQFDNAAWTKRAVTASGGTITATASFGDHTVFQQPSTSGATITASVRAKPGTSNFLFLTLSPTYGLSNYATVVADVATGQVTKTQSGGTLTGATAGISGPDAQGFYRLTLTAANPTTSMAVVVGISNSATPTIGGYGNVDFTAVGTETIITGGAQLELGSTATEYQRITDVNTEVIERFPTATLFQDTAGTTPVTTPGQTVALALDKSKGLTLGPELVTNGTFDSGTTGWNTANASGSVSGGVYLLTPSANFGSLRQNISVVTGRTYQVSLTLTGNALARVYITTATNTVVVGTASQRTFTFVTLATSAAGAEIVVDSGNSTTPLTIDNISVRELSGNHATQSILASRPTYGIVPRTGRRNLLTYTEQFDNAAWVKSGATVSANAATSPDGTTTADRVQHTAGGTGNFVEQGVTTAVASQTITVSGYVRSNTGSNQTFRFKCTHAGVVDYFSGLLTATTEWQRFSFTQTFGAGGTGVIAGVTAGTVATDLLVWGLQAEISSTATTYQRVVSAFDVTEAGVQSLSYLSFDGVDDFLVTPTITPGTDKVQVFAGVRHLSNANYGAMVSFGTTVADQGSLLTWLRSSGGGGQFEAYAKGSSSATTGTVTGTAALTVPATSVFSTLYDIAQSSVTDEIQVRQNGAAMSVAGVSSAGTGNFSAWPMNIGQYNGTQRLHANIFSLVVRFGANLNAGTITSTETWVNGKTGAY